MAVDNKGGSDLDVFEGLGKKSTARGPQAPSASAPPAPPPSLRGGENGTKKGLLVSTPVVPPPPMSQRSAPPPPPGRGALPSVSKPPSAAPPPPPRAEPSTAPAPAQAAGKGGIDMEWDDDEEATHIFDKDKDGSKAEAAPQPPPAPPQSRAPVSSAFKSAAPVPTPPPASKAPPPSSVPVKQTLLGVSGPPPPPPPPSIANPGPFVAPPQTLRPGGVVPPPPSSVGGAFARASSVNSAAPGPVAYPPPPSPMSQQPLPPPPASAAMPPQQTTLPMAMPPRSVAPLPPPPAHSPSSPGLSPPSRTSGRPAEGMPALPPPVASRMEATALVRPPEQNRTMLMVGLVGGITLVLAALFMMWPRSGQIVVNVADTKGGAVPHLQISIDGKKECESAPCIVPDVATGSHTVKVEAAGFEQPADKAVVVEGRKDQRVDFVLTSAAPATPPATGIKVSGNQPGVKLYVDDKEIGSLPQEVKDLSPGSHKIKISGGERYTSIEKTVNVTKDEMQDLGAQTLKVTKGKATVTLATPGAKVFIISGSDRRELPTLPISVDIDTTKQWSLLATKAGMSDYNMPISFDDGQAEKAYNVELEPISAAPKPAPPAAAWTPPSQPAHAWTPPPPKPEPKPEPPSPPPSTAKADNGGGGGGEAFLNINSIPASSVILDGKPIGSTPKLKYSVSPGSHSVLFVNADQGFKKQISVTVGAGETKAAIGKN